MCLLYVILVFVLFLGDVVGDVLGGDGDVFDSDGIVFNGDCDVLGGTDEVVELTKVTKDGFIKINLLS